MKTQKINVVLNDVQNDQISFSNFASQVLEYGANTLNSTTNDYGTFHKQTKTNSERFTEILTIGLLWNKTNQYLSIDAIFYDPLFSFLNKRTANKRLTSLNNRLKNAVLYQQKNRNIPLYQRFEYLWAWIKASNSHTELTDWFEKWQYWAEQLPLAKQQELWDKTEDFTQWFINLSEKHFTVPNRENKLLSTDGKVTTELNWYLNLLELVDKEIDYQENIESLSKQTNITSA